MLSFLFLLLAAAFCSFAAPSEKTPNHASATPILTGFDKRLAKVTRRDDVANSTRQTCGQYKFFDGWQQEFSLWTKLGALASCNFVKYDATYVDKAGSDAVISAFRIEPGCTCWLFQ